LLDKRILHKPGQRPGQQAGRGPHRQRQVHHHDEHQVHRDRAAHDEPRERGLKS
jgi:hypothetical protein